MRHVFFSGNDPRFQLAAKEIVPLKTVQHTAFVEFPPYITRPPIFAAICHTFQSTVNWLSDYSDHRLIFSHSTLSRHPLISVSFSSIPRR